MYDHLIINNGDNTYKGKALFSGAIMNSGSSVPANDVASQKPQAIYDQVVAAGGCSGAADTLECLRALPYEKFQDAATSPPGLFNYQSLDLSYLPRPDPTDNFFAKVPTVESAANSVANVPIIIGDQQDEGTLFTLAELNITTTEQLYQYMEIYFPTAPKSVIQGLVDVYPQDPTQGSPFDTGYANALTPQFKRIAALLGDITFTLTRRATINAFKTGHPSTPVWTYLSTWLHDLPVLGTAHGTDLLEIYFGGLPDPSPRDTFFNKYISFFNYRDPNKFPTAAGGSVNWPEWTNQSLNMLSINAGGNTLIKDNFRPAQYNYLVANTPYLYI